MLYKYIPRSEVLCVFWTWMLKEKRMTKHFKKQNNKKNNNNK